MRLTYAFYTAVVASVEAVPTDNSENIHQDSGQDMSLKCYEHNLRVARGSLDISDLVAAEGALQLESLFQQMQKFRNDIEFDTEAFSLVADTIGKRLLEVQTVIENDNPCDTALIQQLDHSQRTFQIMKGSKEVLSFFNCTGSMDQVLVCKTIGLNVGLLSLYDSRGLPDPTLDSFEKKVIRLSKISKIWHGIFGILENVPLSVRVMFEEQFSISQMLLRALEMFLKENGYSPYA